MALDLASAGFKVYAGVRSENHAEELRKVSNNLIPIVLDITNDHDLEVIYFTLQIYTSRKHMK